LLPATRANICPDFNPGPCSHAATNRIVNGDKYAVAPSPATSLFDRRTTTVPDPSSAGSMSSISNDTSSSVCHSCSNGAARYWPLLPLKMAAVKTDKRFVEYLLDLSDDVTGRTIEALRRAAFQGLADKSSKVELSQLQHVGARMPSVIGRRP
jgi:hypothetical protein